MSKRDSTESEANRSLYAPPLWFSPDWDLSEPLAPASVWAGATGSNFGVDSEAKISAAIEGLGDCAAAERLRRLSSRAMRKHLLADTAALPATSDREGYLADRHLDYWLMGLGDYLVIKDIAEKAEAPLERGSRFLDFGCASGRLLRQFIFQAPDVELYGCDIGRNNVRWLWKHLPPVVRAFQNTLIPSLPLPDDFVDFIYAGSVFTHIGDPEEAWLLELRRILRPNGLAFLTVHTDRTFSRLSDPTHFLTRYFVETPHKCEEYPGVAIDNEFFVAPMPAERLTLIDATRKISELNIFHSEAYLRRHWGLFFHVDGLFEKMHSSHQDGILLRKKEPKFGR